MSKYQRTCALRNIVFPRPVAEHLAANHPDTHRDLARNPSVPASLIDLTGLDANAETVLLRRAEADDISRWCSTRSLKRLGSANTVMDVAVLGFDDQVAFASKAFPQHFADQLVRNREFCDEARAVAAARSNSSTVARFVGTDPSVDDETIIRLLSSVPAHTTFWPSLSAPVLNRPSLTQRCLTSDVPVLWMLATYRDLSTVAADTLTAAAAPYIRELVTDDEFVSDLVVDLAAELLDVPTLSADSRHQLVDMLPPSALFELQRRGVPTSPCSMFAPGVRLADVYDTGVLEAFAARAVDSVPGRAVRLLALLENPHLETSMVAGALRGLDEHTHMYAAPLLRAARATLRADADIGAVLDTHIMSCERTADQHQRHRAQQQALRKVPTTVDVDPPPGYTPAVWDMKPPDRARVLRRKVDHYLPQHKRADPDVIAELSIVLCSEFGDGSTGTSRSAFELFVNLLTAADSDRTVGDLVRAARRLRR